MTTYLPTLSSQKEFTQPVLSGIAYCRPNWRGALKQVPLGDPAEGL